MPQAKGFAEWDRPFAVKAVRQNVMLKANVTLAGVFSGQMPQSVHSTFVAVRMAFAEAVLVSVEALSRLRLSAAAEVQTQRQSGTMRVGI